MIHRIFATILITCYSIVIGCLVFIIASRVYRMFA